MTKHSYWWLTRDDGRVSTIVISPPIDFDTAQKVAAKLYAGGKLEIGLAPQSPQGSDSPSE